MLIFHDNPALKTYLQSYQEGNKSIGLVPTMGALHAGHLSLIERALQENDLVVVSIFVNPTQFNNAEDLEKYPRTLERDLITIKSLNQDKRITVYAPTIADIYGNKVVSESFSYEGLENQMEGKSRPGHFDGVGTIVSRLFRIVNPQRAYFGEKDFQQLQIIRKMTANLGLPVEIVECPIFRNSKGLAMSSRNERLNSEQQEEATYIYQTLLAAKDMFRTSTISEVKAWVYEQFEKKNSFELEYFEIADEKTLEPISEKIENHSYRGFIVVHLNGVRLIDTLSFN